jgi:transcriptional regulator of acetoin/glycerol metabolism
MASRLQMAIHASRIGQRDIADDLAGGAVTTFLKTIRKPFGVILPFDEVERRVICDALDKCGGNYLLAARLLGIGKTTVYRKARAYNYQSPRVQGKGLMTVSQDLSFQHGPPGSAHEHK